MTDRISKTPLDIMFFLYHYYLGPMLPFPSFLILSSSSKISLSPTIFDQDESRVGPGGSYQWKFSHREQPYSSGPAGNYHTGTGHVDYLQREALSKQSSDFFI